MKIDDTYEIDLKSTTTFNRFAVVDVEVTMKKPDDESENYKADSGKIYVNGEEITGGGYPEPTGTIELTENGTFNVKDYAEASVNVDIPEPPTGTLDITENGTFDVTDYASANVNVPSYPEPTGTITIIENGTFNVKDYAEANINVPSGETFEVRIIGKHYTSDMFLNKTTGVMEYLANIPYNNDDYIIGRYNLGKNIKVADINTILQQISVDYGTTQYTVHTDATVTLSQSSFLKYTIISGERYITVNPSHNYFYITLSCKPA